MDKPLCIDLFCGLGGWAEGFLAEGYYCVGFDIERHDYGTGGYPGQLVIQDVITLRGSQFKNAAVIVASPPCTEYSYMAMPWSRAKQIRAALLGNGEIFPKGYSGSRTVTELNALFDACFRIQREACEAAGRHIPLIVENVRGAQPWVGRSAWNFGSFHLWGDVPALMPITMGRQIMKRGISHRPDEISNSHGHGKKIEGQNWSRFKESGEVSPHWIMQSQNVRADGTKLPGNNAPIRWEDREIKRLCDVPAGEGLKLPSESGRRADMGNGARFTTRDCGLERFSVSEDGVKGFTPNGEPLGKNKAARLYGSKSPKRKAASAQIAKIPFPLAQHLARVFKPRMD